MVRFVNDHERGGRLLPARQRLHGSHLYARQRHRRTAGQDDARGDPVCSQPKGRLFDQLLAVREWADHVLFLGYDIDVRDGKGTGSGTRTIYPSELPHCMAKSRTMADPLPLMKFDPALWTQLLK